MPSFLHPPPTAPPFSFPFPFLLLPACELVLLSLSPTFMATSARDPPDHPPESRAPPPSPVAASPTDGSESPEKDELTGFLTHSLRVPKLNLPDRIFPRNPTQWNPPEINFQALVSPQNDGSALELLKSTWSAFGCFQLLNHGIPRDLITAGEVAAAAAFRIPAEKKKATARSPEKRWGFEVEEEEGGEEFIWYRSGMREELAGIWPQGYKDFSDKTEGLWVEIEKIASKMGEILLENNGAGGAWMCSMRRREEGVEGSILCLHKHRRNDLDGGLKNEVLRMAIRSLDCLHGFCLHICGGASEFHIYSKRGWFQFRPGKEAIIITIGNQIKACSGGLYKNVIGKPIFQDGGHQDSISISYLYSHPIRTHAHPTVRGEKTISLTQQVMIAACLVLLCRIIIYLYGSI